MNLTDRLRKMDDIFAPLKKCKGKPVAITTWGVGSLGDPSMIHLLDKLYDASELRLLIGYSKNTHDLRYLLSVGYAMNGVGRNSSWRVRFLPSFHTKLWIVGNGVWGGSCNFAPNTCVNQMWKIPYKGAKAHFELYWKQAPALSKSTDLLLIPQARIHA